MVVTPCIRGRPTDIDPHRGQGDQRPPQPGHQGKVDGRAVPVKELLRNAARGQNIMVFKDGLRARINEEWLSRYRTLVEFGGVEKSGTKVKVRRHAAARLAVGLAEAGGAWAG